MKEKNGEHPFGDAGQVLSLSVFLVVWIGDSFILRWSTVLSNHIPFSIRLVILGLTLAAAVSLFRSGHAVVGHSHRPQCVVTTGAFRWVRHPLYSASLVTYLGLTISTASLLSLLICIGIFMFHNCIASYEEKLLEIRFGEEYAEYKRKTGRWIPRIGRRTVA